MGQGREDGRRQGRLMKRIFYFAVLAVGGCSTAPLPSIDPAQACSALARPIAASAIGLPSGGATIESATVVAPAPLAVNLRPPFGPPPPEVAVVPESPEYCRVIGAIAPVDPKAPPIRFQVNL